MHRFVPPDSGQQMYPQASPSGDQGELFDTGWDVHYPGPARIYLSETDIRDVLSSDDVLERALICELLEARGWTAPGRTAAALEESDLLLTGALADLEAAVEKAETLQKAFGWMPAGVTTAATGLADVTQQVGRGF